MATTTALNQIFSKQYTLDMLRDEARQLIEKGLINRNQPIFALCGHIPAREWPYMELELERCDFLLRDRILDLLGREDWSDD